MLAADIGARRSPRLTGTMNDPLDFEVEDQLIFHPPPAAKRNKVISLDDLLADYHTQQSEVDVKAHKKPKTSNKHDSDEDDKNQEENEMKFLEMASECEKQMNEIIPENDIPLWGQKIFGQQVQKSPALLNFAKLETCKLLQPLRVNELSSDLLDYGQGESFLEGLLINGWLAQLAFISGFVEASVASWTFYKLLYSSNEDLELSACDFWCSVLLSKHRAGQPSVELEWIPSYIELKNGLTSFGYLLDSSEKGLLNSNSSYLGSEGPPHNIRSWIKVLSACFQIRKFQPIFSVSEAEELLIVNIHLFLDRKLQGLSTILSECMQSAISFFSENEWDVSCDKVAHAIADSVPKDLNCLRVVECITGVSSREKRLRSRMAVHILGILVNKFVADGKGILTSLLSVKVKDKGCDFFKLYIYLVLSEKWLLTYESVEERYVILNLWSKFLRNCSSNISSTDWRLYASKVRNKASYLLQSTIQKGGDE